MQIQWPKLIVALCTIAMLGFTVHAADVKKPLTPQEEKYFRSRMRVKVNITADKSINNLVSTSLNKELRSLRDVDIVDRSHEWEINVIAIEFRTAGGHGSGIIVSTVILTPFDSNLFLSNKLKPEQKDNALDLTSRLFWYPDHSVYVTRPDELESTLKKIVGTFNTRYLEKERKSRRSFKDVIEKRK